LLQHVGGLLDRVQRLGHLALKLGVLRANTHLL
jgi:hypothetical protein